MPERFWGFDCPLPLLWVGVLQHRASLLLPELLGELSQPGTVWGDRRLCQVFFQCFHSSFSIRVLIAVSAAAVGVYPWGTLQTFSDCRDVVAAAAGAEKMLGKKKSKF